MLLRSLDQALLGVGDLPFACFKLPFEIGAGPASSTKPRLRFGQVKLAASRSILRPFARQGHLHRQKAPVLTVAAGDRPGENSMQPSARVSRSREAS